MSCVLSIAAHGDPAHTSVDAKREARRERDRLTPINHPLRSRTSLKRDARWTGDRWRDYYQRKASRTRQ